MVPSCRFRRLKTFWPGKATRHSPHPNIGILEYASHGDRRASIAPGVTCIQQYAYIFCAVHSRGRSARVAHTLNPPPISEDQYQQHLSVLDNNIYYISSV